MRLLSFVVRHFAAVLSRLFATPATRQPVALLTVIIILMPPKMSTQIRICFDNKK